MGGVGGGQEPGEDVWATARREAREELGVGVELIGSSITHVRDLDDKSSWTTTTVDNLAPFALQRMVNEDPDTPFKPGLPAGPFTYFALFLARIERIDLDLDPSGDDDIAALVWIPLGLLSTLRHTSTTGACLVERGARVAAGSLAPDARVRLAAKESLADLGELLVEQARRASSP
jgi:8-oxo-dGTP pyrophosphatase MutT (NUDIX family)